MHASRINYWNTDKLVCFVLSFFVFVTQQYKQRTAWKVSLQSIQPYNRKYGECVKRAPQRLIIGKPISQYASYSAMFCPLYSNISKEQHEKHLCNPSSHYGKYICETHAPYLDKHTETITCLSQIVTLRGCEEKYRRSKGYIGSTLMQAL